MPMEDVSKVNQGAADPRLVRAVAELQGLQVSLLTGAGASVAIAVPNIEIEDTILAALNFTDGTTLTLSHVSINDRRAYGTLTIGTGLVDGDKVSVNGKVYTFTEMVESITTNVGPRVIPITVDPSGVDPDVVAARFAKVIMSADSSLVCTVSATGVVNIHYRTPGTGGNAVALDVTQSNSHVTRSGATLSGGTATNSIKVTDDTTGKKIQLFWFDKQ